MSRRRTPEQRTILPDPKYHNQTLAKFINHVMVHGKKSVAERIVYGALTIIEEREKTDPIETFEKALDEVAPTLEVKSRRVGGATYQIPVEVRPGRSAALAMRWLVESARSRRKPREMAQRLASEMLDASKGRGAAVNRRLDSHRMAEANKMFAHYRY